MAASGREWLQYFCNPHSKTSLMLKTGMGLSISGKATVLIFKIQYSMISKQTDATVKEKKAMPEE